MIKSLMIAALLAVGFVGCSDDEESAPVYVSPYGQGTIDVPYVVNTNGLYDTLTETYYEAKQVTADCNVTINPLDDEVYGVLVYDQSYTPVLPLEDGVYSFTVPSYGSYTVLVKSYTATKIGIDFSCYVSN